MRRRNIYLDHASTTPVDPRVLDAMLPFFTKKFGNASSVHAFGRETRTAIEEARESIARLFRAEPSEILFTSGGTEADNLAIKGTMLSRLSEGKNHIITSRAEHHAVLKCCEYLEENGFHVSYLDVDSHACVNPDDVRNEIRPETGLVTVMHMNNEVGSINPVDEIGAITSECQISFHSDTTQSSGKMQLDVKKSRIDLAVCSAHKLYGPKGIGALYVRKGTELEYLLHGGPQERGRRSGTENTPLIVGFGKAAEIALQEGEKWASHVRTLRKLLIREIRSLSPHIRIHQEADEYPLHILSVSFDSKWFDITGETLLMRLDLEGISVSSGSACTAGSIEPSHVIQAMGFDKATADATLRFSFGRGTTEGDIEDTTAILKNILSVDQSS